MSHDLVCALIGYEVLLPLSKVENKLYYLLKSLIEEGFGTFLLALNGEFDELALYTLICLKTEFKFIKIRIVFIPETQKWQGLEKHPDIEIVRYNICPRSTNQRRLKSCQLMIDEADLVVAFVKLNATFGNAEKTLKYAIKRKKKIVDIFYLSF